MNKQKTILVIEDEKSVRDAILDVLHRANFLSYSATNGEEGLELAFKKHPDLILLDLMMPVLDGTATLKKIRRDAWGAHVPIIVLTNLSAADETLINDMVTYKPINYLIKSDWKIHDVVKKIEDIFSTNIKK